GSVFLHNSNTSSEDMFSRGPDLRSLCCDHVLRGQPSLYLLIPFMQLTRKVESSLYLPNLIQSISRFVHIILCELIEAELYRLIEAELYRLIEAELYRLIEA
ncbi:unnamed protein product, partial [Lymnaea stagnalis]